MKEIPLTQGQFAIVDDADFDWLNQWKWYAQISRQNSVFYAAKGGGNTQVLMHRLILGLQKGDKKQADHINHNGLDNRRCNLRIVSNIQNHWNLRDVKGYTWCKRDKKWQARIYVNKRRISLGYFDTKEQAHQAYLDAKTQYHIF